MSQENIRHAINHPPPAWYKAGWSYALISFTPDFDPAILKLQQKLSFYLLLNHFYEKWLSELLLLSYQLQTVWPFCSELKHFHLENWDICFFFTIIYRVWVFLETSDLVGFLLSGTTTVSHSKSLKPPFFLILVLSFHFSSCFDKIRLRFPHLKYISK